MGSFAVEDRLIRIHPVLDHPSVPDYFVAWIVFHEMLHGKYEVVRKGDRRCFHSKEFIAEERTFRRLPPGLRLGAGEHGSPARQLKRGGRCQFGKVPGDPAPAGNRGLGRPARRLVGGWND